MRKMYITVAICLIGLFSGCSNGSDFREMKWGMSFDEVKATEKGIADTRLESSGAIFYDTKVSGHDALLMYYADGDKGVISATYSITVEPVNDEAIGVSFSVLEDDYAEKYGKPKSETVEWYNERYKDSTTDEYRALSAGDLKKEVKWETSNTEITLVIDKKEIQARYWWKKAFDEEDNI